MEYTSFVTVTSDKKSYTFGYLWYKESESSDRHLYLGKSGKGSCIHIVYNSNEKTAFKTNIGYFKECDINKSLKRGAGGTYLMIFCAMYLLIKKYPQCKLIDWIDNSMITLRINNRDYDISLSNSDTIIKGYPRIQDIISKEAIVFKEYPIITNMLLKLNNTDTIKLSFNEFYNKFYKPYYKSDLFTLNEMNIIKHIYNKSSSILDFFKVADNYLTTVDKKKYIFIPLEEILHYYQVIGFVGKNWIVDIHKAFSHIKKTYNISFSRSIIQSGSGTGNIIKKLTKPLVIHYKNRCFIKNRSYYFPIYRKLIENIK